jgi:hypothetical protein
LTLPLLFQTASNFISRSGGKISDGTMVVIVKLSAFQNSNTVKDLEKKNLFEDL